MKICIPTRDDRALEARVSPHLGRAPFLAVADSETGEVKMTANGGGGHGQGGCGATARIRGLGVEAVACRGLGRGALAALEAAGIDVFRSEQPTVGEVVAELRAGRAGRFPAAKTCDEGHHHHHGHHDHGESCRHG